MEADFRFSLVRMREYAEGVALYAGEATEQRGHLARLERIRQNWYALMHYTKRLGAFTIGYGQIAVVFPYFVAGHRYFSGAIPLGGLTQIANAFGQVQSSLSWFVDSYTDLANWKASVDRLLTFHHAVDRATAEAQAKTGERIDRACGKRAAGRRSRACPAGQRRHAGPRHSFRRCARVEARRKGAAHRPVRQRQKHALSHARRHLALRPRLACAFPKARA